MNKMIEFKQSEWFGVGADLFLKALNEKKISNSELVVREALQNSYDARLDKQIPVDFMIKGMYLSEENVNFFEKILPTRESFVALELNKNLKQRPYCIQFRDSNTCGLNGPYQEYDERGNKINILTESNYKNFVWAIGGEKGATKGGSFGVGKTSLFLISRVKTICIYSRTKYNGKLESRFIIKSFYPYEFSSTEKTFQYWFCCKRENEFDKNTTPLPFLNEEADDIAKGIGMDLFKENETGTNSMVLFADFNTEENEFIDSETHFVNNFPKIILKWFWTKLSANTPVDKKINISLYNGNTKLEIEDPSDTSSAYFPFFRALEIWREENKKITRLNESEKNLYKSDFRGFIPIVLGKPKILLGALVFLEVSSSDDVVQQTFFKDGKNLCLTFMRDVEFCIKYENYNYPQIQEGRVVFALFHTDPTSYDPKNTKEKEICGSVDEAFRNSETKTHEEWNEQSLKGREKTYVKRAKEIIKEKLDELFNQTTPLKTTSNVSSALLSLFGKYLPYGAGGAASKQIDSTSKNHKTASKDSSIGNFKIYGEPQYLKNNWRMITCYIEWKKEPMSCYIVPVLITIDGKVVTKGLASERVKIKYVKWGENLKNLTDDRIFIEGNKIRFSKKGCYMFYLDVLGDIDFDLRLVKV